MTTNDLSFALVAAFEDYITELLDGEDNTVEVESARTFQDAGLLTSADGLVLKLGTGEEFHITIGKVGRV